MVIKKTSLFFVLLLVTISFVFAGFESSNYSISSNYGESSNIKGWINMGFDEEDGNSLFEDARDNSISLLELLKLQSGYDFTCEPEACEYYYSATNRESQKSLSVQNGDEVFVGFSFSNKNLVDIINTSFEISSGSQESNTNQIEVDLFADGTIDLGNTNIGLGYSEDKENYGCFNENYPSKSEYTFNTNSRFCQKITLKKAPGFTVGAWVKKVSGSMTLTMELHDGEKYLGSYGATCELGTPTTSGSELNCDMDYLVTEEKDYYLCISGSNGGTGTNEYKIRGYSQIDKCGFSGNPVPDETPAAYQMFTLAKKFGPVGTIKVENQLSSGDTISDLMKDYLVDNYGSLGNCKDSECVIPIKIISGASQTINFKNLEIEYEESGVGVTEETSFYDIEETAPLVSSDLQKLYLDNGNFSVPSQIGTYNFVLTFDGEEIVSEEVEVVESADIKYVTPRSTANSLPTTFSVVVGDGKNITKYEWDFGDNSTKTTTTNYAEHTYNSIGNFTLGITITDSEGGVSSDSFTIQVGSAEDVLDDMIEKKGDDLFEIKAQIEAFDSFSSQEIKRVLDLDAIDLKFQEIRDNYTSTLEAEESYYAELLSELINLEVPESVSKTMVANPILFFPQTYNINLDYIDSITGDYHDTQKEESYKQSVLGWMQLNYETKVSMNEYSADYGFGNEILVKTFKISTKNIDSSESIPYFIIREMDEMNFEDNKSLTYEDGYYYKEIGSSDTIEFSTTESILFEDLPFFISPPTSELSLVEDVSELEPSNKKWVIFGALIFVLLILGFGVYLFLKKWYGTKYENYLFKDKNKLYNMVIYIQSAKQQGMSDEEIIKNLRKAKWSNEQVNYVMRKYAGKRTGMPGFGSGKPKMKKKVNPQTRRPAPQTQRMMLNQGMPGRPGAQPQKKKKGGLFSKKISIGKK